MALRQAGIPQSSWVTVDMTGDAQVVKDITARLVRNELTAEGTSTLRITGSGKDTSTLIGAGTIPPK